MSIILDLPMDEAQNSPIAYDYSPSHKNAPITNATFVPGHTGYAIQFQGLGYGRPGNPPVDLSGPFTVMFWLKSQFFPPFSPPDQVKFMFAFSNASIEQVAIPCVLDTWEHFGFVRDGNDVRIYKNLVQVSSITFTAGNPVEWAVKQHVSDAATLTATLTMIFGGSDAPYALGEMDQLLIFNAALTTTEIANAADPKNKRVFYRIDGIPFEDYECFVSDSRNVIDSLDIKDQTTVDWANEHGLIVDLHRPRYKVREIELDCFMHAGGMLEFTMKLDNFLKLFQGPGLHRLKIEIDQYKPLVYEVYAPDNTNLKKRWNDEDMIGTFTLKLTDTNPIRRVLRFVQPVDAPVQGPLSPFPQGFKGVYIQLKCPDAVNIFWGDGTSELDVLAEDYLLLSHTYPEDGKAYEIIISGEITNITSFITNGIVVWNRL